MKRIIFGIAALTLALHAGIAHAQDHPTDRGMSLGLRLGAGNFATNHAVGGDRVDGGGGGLALTAAYHFSPIFGLQLEFSGFGYPLVEPGIDAASASIALLMQYRFLPGNATRPYVRAGLALYGLGFSNIYGDNTTVGGVGVPLGVGVDFLVARHVSLGIDLMHDIIAYQEAHVELPGGTFTYDIDNDGSQTRLSMSVMFYF